MYKTFLSWRYMTSRRTNLIGIVGIFVGVAALIMILSIMTGFLDESRSFIRGTLADIVISPRTDELAASGAQPAEPEPILALLAEDPRVAAAAPHLGWFGALLADDSRAADMFRARAGSTVLPPEMLQLVGIDLERELAATELGEALTREPLFGESVHDPARPFDPPPGYVPAGRPKAGVIVGDQVMFRFRLRPGDEINIGTMVPDPASGELVESNRKFVVTGSFRSRDNETDASRVYLERSELQSLIGGTRTYSEILVRLEDYDRDAAAVREDLVAELSARGLILGDANDDRQEVVTWEQVRQNILGAIENERALMGIMLSLVLLVAGFTVFAILSMMVTEKRRDIGILAAVGSTPRGVLSLFLMIGLWDAVIGSALGAAAGVWAALRIDPIERWLSDKFGFEIFDRNVYLFDHIPSRVIPEAVAAIVAGAVLATLLFSALPAWRASRLDPLEALRHE